MKRRDVLKAAGAIGLAGTAMAASPGCALLPRDDPAADERDAKAFLASLDHSLELADHARPVHQIVAKLAPGARSPQAQQLVDSHERMFRDMLRTLFITQSFRDLSPATQNHPAVQARMRSHLDEVDTTVFSLTDYLAGQTADERAQLRVAMREHPRAPMDIAEALDEHAAVAGVSKARRRQLRQMMSQATFRMRSESPGSLIDEYTRKAQRLRGQDENSALALALAQKLGDREFWRHQERLAQLADQGQPQTPATAAPATPTSVAPAPPRGVPPGMAQVQPPAPAPHHDAGRGAIRGGALCMGIGLIDFGAGALIVNVTSSSSALFVVGMIGGMTIGAVLFALGFIVLIAGLVIKLAA